MSLRYEQYRSLKITREFLLSLLDAQTRPKSIKETKRRVLTCLHHFPTLAESGKPIFSQDNFTDDDAA